jgi:hypothetical protein
MPAFISYGRDMETLLSKVKMCHAMRIFGDLQIKEKRRILSEKDMNGGYELFLETTHADRKKDIEDKQQQQYLAMTLYV